MATQILEDQVTRTPQRILFWMLLVVVAWLPIPLGSNRGWSWSLMELLIFVLAAGLIVVHMMGRMPLPRILRKHGLLYVLLAVWIVYHLFQTFPMQLNTLGSLSPTSIELYRYLLGDNLPSSLPLSLDQGETLQAFLKAAAYIILFLLTITLVNSRQRLNQLAMLIVYVGTAEALFGLVNVYTNGQLWHFAQNDRFGRVVTGTFINRNHFAGLMEMVIPLALGLILAQKKQQQFYPSFKARLRGWMSFLLSGQSRLYLYVLIMFAALFMSVSRGGVLSLFAALTVGIILLRLIGRGGSSDAHVGSIVLLLVFSAALWFGVDGLVHRLEKGGIESSRGQILAATYPLISDYAMFGSGAGVYEWIFPLYKTPELGHLIYDHAHNDYAELLADQGIVGFILLALPLLLIYKRLLKELTVCHDPLRRGVLFGVICGTMSMLIHAFADFNFHIPSNAAYFWCLLGMGIAATNIRHRRRVQHK